jgi:anti-sigma regulatory factor (Ser/Thr protein kinase)
MLARRFPGYLSPQEIERLQLLVSELVTNSVRHASLQPTEHVEVTVVVTDAQVRVEVSDPGPGFSPRMPPEPSPDAESGWGLYLVDRLASRWGVRSDAFVRTWFEIERVPPLRRVPRSSSRAG